ncbi:hypothetical protein [Dongia sp.]|uniref:hypothetical protein n=1 Tax=Dongia sp. TaxID=1977262 RepID=UPI0037510830
MKRHSAAGILLAATTVVASATGAAAATAPVKVELWNKADGSQGMTLSTDHAKAGKVAFEVKNSSTSMVHEFLIWKTDLAFDKFPKDPDNPAKVDEDKLKGVEELSSDLDPGKSGSLTMDLKPGRYVVFCNQPGHFDAGMHLAFTVTK